jgi:hypothetical protein
MRNSLAKRVAMRVARAYGAVASLPFRFRSSRISPPEKVFHSGWIEFLSKEFNQEGYRILEIGSRNVTGISLKSFFDRAEYIGFDFYAGQNVDVVGDVHKLSRYFHQNDKFDLIFSSAVFEHLHMPWVAAVEIQKMLKVGGYVFIETHFSFSSHERPWHFFQFSEMGLRALFNGPLGFDLIDSGMSNPIAGYFSHGAAKPLRYLPVTELYCHSEILCRKRCEVDGFEWSEVGIDEITEETRYPMPHQ